MILFSETKIGFTKHAFYLDFLMNKDVFYFINFKLQ